jgi:endogenous inhibitor of DNA gyrase (YacG/DUF329 family)
VKRHCPICGKKVVKPFDTSTQLSAGKAQGEPTENKGKTAKASGFFPFCSERCKLVDLNGWFDSKYVISKPVNDMEIDSRFRGNYEEERKNNKPDEPENVLK